jgi:F0F1-type ATP synthase membrane subunit c/vacuolar-type H+-ATPase subunit K
VWATLGGAVIVGIAALLVATVVAIAVDGLARVVGRRNDR